MARYRYFEGNGKMWFERSNQPGALANLSVMVFAFFLLWSACVAGMDGEQATQVRYIFTGLHTALTANVALLIGAFRLAW